MPQQLEAALELGDLLRQRDVLAGADGQRHPVRLHAHAAGFVDGRRAAVELPRNPQRQRDRKQRQQQERRPTSASLLPGSSVADGSCGAIYPVPGGTG